MTDAPEQRGPEGRDAAARAASSSPSASPSAGPGSREEPEHAAQPLPLDRSVLWVPRKLRLTGQEVSTPYDVFVTQSVLRDVGQHVASAPDEVVGLLGGRLYRCPETGRPWVRLDAALPAADPVPENADAETLASALAALRKRLELSGARTVGWYHSHAFLGVFLSDRDARFHRRHFPEPWQCALVLVADRDRPAGGLFQPTAAEQIPQNVYLPLYEITGRDARTPDGRKRAVLSWGNYVPDEPVAREAPAPYAAASPAGRRAAAGGGGAYSPFARASDRGRGGPPRTVAAPDEETLDVPLVLPADEASGAGAFLRRLGRLLVRLAALALLAFGGWLLWDRVIDRPEEERTAAAAGGTQGAARPEPTGAVTGFLRARDDFLRSVDSYQERSTDFDLQRIGCEGLTSGYQSVDEAFLRMSEVYVALRDESGPPPAERYEEAARRMEEVDRHFDGSGCPRPQ